MRYVQVLLHKHPDINSTYVYRYAIYVTTISVFGGALPQMHIFRQTPFHLEEEEIPALELSDGQSEDEQPWGGRPEGRWL